MKHFFFIFFAIVSCNIVAQTQYTQIFDDNYKTLEIKAKTSAYSYPVLNINEMNFPLTISFDELSHNTKNLTYAVKHCNADWTIDNLSRFEYIEGVDYASIEDYETSINTYVEYTHYWFQFPSEYMYPTVTGNFLIQVYEDSDPEKIILQTRCYVYDSQASIVANIRSNTNIDLIGKHQQVDFDVYTNRLKLFDPTSDIKVVLRQNGRTDNEISSIKPTALYADKISFTNNKDCIFEAGNEYHTLDISNKYIKDFEVGDIKFIDEIFHVEMLNALPRNEKYEFYTDANGKFIVNLQRNYENDQTEADYFWVHFFIPTEAPAFDGRFFVVGDFNSQLLNSDSEMIYDSKLNGYRASFLLKQGGYNYLYLFRKKGETKGTCEPFEGSFWQTSNEYEIFVYYRTPQNHFDQLVGYKLLNN